MNICNSLEVKNYMYSSAYTCSVFDLCTVLLTLTKRFKYFSCHIISPQELKNLRPQLYSAAEYCEKSYLLSEQKQM